MTGKIQPDDTKERTPMGTATQDALFTFERSSLERLKLAADVILAEGENIGDALTAELAIFRDRVEHALLLPFPAASDQPGPLPPIAG
jgi:hypothetical protein